MIVITKTGTEITVKDCSDEIYPFVGKYSDKISDIFAYNDKEDAIEKLMKIYYEQITEQIIAINKMEN